MTYQLTQKAAQQRQRLTAMRAGRERARLAAPAPDYPPTLPDLRRRIVIESFDFGHEIHVLEFFKTNRIDCFRVVVDGHSIEETDWNQCDSCGKPIYDEEPAVPPAPTFERNWKWIFVKNSAGWPTSTATSLLKLPKKLNGCAKN